jgi:hypothetical protein
MPYTIELRAMIFAGLVCAAPVAIAAEANNPPTTFSCSPHCSLAEQSQAQGQLKHDVDALLARRALARKSGIVTVPRQEPLPIVANPVHEDAPAPQRESRPTAIDLIPGVLVDAATRGIASMRAYLDSAYVEGYRGYYV